MGLLSHIFQKNNASIQWFKVFDSEDEAQTKMPINKPITVLIQNTKICFVRTQKGFFAIADACPHLGASLSKGVCNDFMEIVCPWHSYRFALQSGNENNGHTANMNVKTYATKLEKSGIYIGIEK